MVVIAYFLQRKGAESSDVSVYDLRLRNGQSESNLDFETLRDTFPFVGDFHFRAKVETGRGSGDYAWMDLSAGMRVPRYRGLIFLKVLNLGRTMAKNRDAPVYRWNPSDHRTVIDEVKKKAKTHMSALGKSVAGFLSGAVSRLSGKKEASTAVVRQLVGLKKKMNTRVSFSVDIHTRLLKRLWRAAIPRGAFSTRSEKWTQIGFQSEDPSTDFRSGGELALRCLVFLAETYPAEFLVYISPKSSMRSERRGYPVCIAGINLVLMLADIVGLSKAPNVEPGPYWAMFEDPKAFYVAFRVSFSVLDQIWKHTGASLTDFGSVIERTKGHIIKALERGSSSVEDFEAIVVENM